MVNAGWRGIVIGGRSADVGKLGRRGRGAATGGGFALMLVIALAGCGDPVVILGDAPGVMRVVAGKPEDLEPAERVPATDFELSSPRPSWNSPGTTCRWRAT